jgi:broad specificity phosphatase PhoE
VYSSPLRRAWETARHLAMATGLELRPDERLRERVNWDGTQSMEAFLSDWARCANDRDCVPHAGDSSRQTGARMLAFVQEQLDGPDAVAAVTHGGATVDLLRTLPGDAAVPAALMQYGVPACAVTILDRSGVVDIARTDHLG